MTYYIIGFAAAALLALAMRRYFGKKYGGERRCNGCQGCPYAKKCAEKKNER